MTRLTDERINARFERKMDQLDARLIANTLTQQDYDAAVRELDAWAEEQYNAGPWFVCLYLIDRAYGGPEEGGWYYECGQPEPTQHLRVFDTIEEARAYVMSLKPVEVEMNAGRPDISSVLSRGCYDFRIARGWPEAYPANRPHYE